MGDMTTDGDQVRIWKEIIVACFKAIFRRTSGKARKNRQTSQTIFYEYFPQTWSTKYVATLLNIMKCNYNVTVSLVLCGFKMKANGVMTLNTDLGGGGGGVSLVFLWALF